MSDSDDFASIDCDHVLTGMTAQVLMAKSVTAAFFELETRKQARLLSNTKLWADGQRPNGEQFNGNEGRCGGQNDRMLVAIKVHKVRLYGFIRRYKEKRTLILVDIDSDKKQNRACLRILKRAKGRVRDMDNLCG